MTNLVCVETLEIRPHRRSFLTLPDGWHAFLQVVNSLSVAVLNSQVHQFPGGGFSGVALLSESHAAIHTWPEKGIAWCELATCGDPSDLERFAQLLRELETQN